MWVVMIKNYCQGKFTKKICAGSRQSAGWSWAGSYTEREGWFWHSLEGWGEKSPGAGWGLSRDSWSHCWNLVRWSQSTSRPLPLQQTPQHHQPPWTPPPSRPLLHIPPRPSKKFPKHHAGRINEWNRPKYYVLQPWGMVPRQDIDRWWRKVFQKSFILLLWDPFRCRPYKCFFLLLLTTSKLYIKHPYFHWTGQKL